MLWKDTAILAAIVQSVGTIVAAVIAAIVAAVIGHQIANRKRLQEKLLRAQEDIAFLLAVEEEHCKKHMQVWQESFKNRVRRAVRTRGLSWSGRFTPGRLTDNQFAEKNLVTNDHSQISR